VQQWAYVLYFGTTLVKPLSVWQTACLPELAAFQAPDPCCQ